MVDLYRSVLVRLDQIGTPETTKSMWPDMMVPALDATQLTMDQKHLASEVHVLLKKKPSS
jgi:hypothetical protein